MSRPRPSGSSSGADGPGTTRDGGTTTRTRGVQTPDNVSDGHDISHNLATAGRAGGSGHDPMGRRSDYNDPTAHPQAPSRTPDAYTPGGDPIYYRPGGTAIGYDGSTMRNFDMAGPLPGYHDVVVHGERNGLFRPGQVGADGADYPANYTHPQHIADAVRNNPYYDGGPVRLVSCHTGTVDADAGVPPAGRQVADALGVEVRAPTNAVGVDRYGEPGQEPLIRGDGTWETFEVKGAAE